MKTNIKNKILKLFALLTMLTCIVITFLGSTFKPMKTTFADTTERFTATVIEDNDLPDDLRPVKVGDDLTGKTFYFINFSENLCPPNTSHIIFSDGDGFSWSLLSSSNEIRFGFPNNCSIEPFAMIPYESDQSSQTVKFQIPSFDIVGYDFTVTAFSVMVENQNYFMVSASEMGDVIEETPGDEPTDETPGIIEGIGNETLDFFADSLGLGAGAVVGFSLIILLLTFIFRKK